MSTSGFLFEILPFCLSLNFFLPLEVSRGPPCPPFGPIVLSYFTNNTDLR